MKNATALTKCVQVGGQDFNWRVHRQPQWCTADGWKGLAIHVELARNSQRDLILEFPFKITNRRSTPHRQRPSVSDKQIANAISAAIASGWEPESRGKTFMFEVDEVDGN